jgi:hypothetical protein
MIGALWSRSTGTGVSGAAGGRNAAFLNVFKSIA